MPARPAVTDAATNEPAAARPNSAPAARQRLPATRMSPTKARGRSRKTWAANRDGPDVLHRRRIGEHAGEAVVTEGETPVEHLARGRQHVAPEPWTGADPKSRLKRDDRSEHERKRWDQAPGPPLPEAGHRHPTVL